MSRYRKLEVRTWADENFRALSPLQPSGQALWFFLLTGPQTGPIPGLYRAGRAAMAEELGWTPEEFARAFDELAAKGMAKADFKARLVWLPNALKHNKPESPNVVRSWRVELDLLPECELKREAIAQIRATVDGLGEPYRQAFDEAMAGTRKATVKPSVKPTRKAKPNQEQQQEQEQEQDDPAAGTADDPPEIPMNLAAPAHGAYTAAELSKAMRQFGINANPSNLLLQSLARQGITPDTVKAACEEAKRSKPGESIGVVYVARIVERWARDATALKVAGASAPKPAGGAWWASDAAILAKGAELGLSPRAGETMAAFKGRIEAALQGPAKPAPPAPCPAAPPQPPPGPVKGKPPGLDLMALVSREPPGRK